ncbi:hypothetical protein JTE90_007682 [Oedothorax gibbosus]|uniref:Uncharacterized protein n=1 Tax=Oedothorax gibbosus TaxID=931172 RepID=A0AAV6UK26_9ARAC|nr:hypothetical protein JTE90_007682 [Oedothorax gibbosus]
MPGPEPGTFRMLGECLTDWGLPSPLITYISQFIINLKREKERGERRERGERERGEREEREGRERGEREERERRWRGEGEERREREHNIIG